MPDPTLSSKAQADEAKARDDELLMSLVELALAQPKGEREVYLRTACASDPALFQQVWEYVQWDDRMSGFLLEPLFPPPESDHTFEAGQLLLDRFRIVREVAQGGMGIVYEARDERLDRRIALKCAKTGFRKRLPPEVRNASEISHPNVCKIYEIHTASVQGEEIDFLTMEFLDGQTLAERLKAGPLTAEESRTIGRQLAAGLAEAHRNQVVHGDLKSSNVILAKSSDGSLRAVITDFGLARRPQSAQTGAPSDVMGAPDYMAPERWKGEKASLASDVYALGVILFELASGRRPFRPDVSMEDRLTRKPPSLHHPWNRVLTRSLDPDPAKRHSSATDVDAALEPPAARRWLITAAAAIVAVASATGFLSYRSANAPREAVRLAVLPFESTGDTAMLAEQVFRNTSERIGALKGNARVSLTVTPSSAVLRAGAVSDSQAREALGLTHALHATVSRRDGKVVVQARLTDARSLVNAKQWSAEYADPETRFAPVALAGFVTATLRLPPLVTSTSVNDIARADYLAGLGYLRRNSTVDAALAALERALTADPDSPLTHAAMGEAQRLKANIAQEPRWKDLAAASLRQAERRNPDLAAVLRLSGLIKADSGLYEAAAADYRRAIELDPANSDAYRRLGDIYEQGDDLAQALEVLQQAVAVEPNYFKTHQQLGAFFYNRARYDEAISHFQKTVALAPDEPRAHYSLGATLMATGRIPEAESELRVAAGLQETATTLNSLAVALMYQSKDEEAIPYLLRTVELSPQRYKAWMNLGIAYHRTNRVAKAQSANRRGLDLVEPEIARDPRSGYTRSLCAYFYAQLGDARRADSEIAQALRLSPNDADTRWNAVLTYEALGKREKTLEALSSAPAGLLTDLARWPDLADLHKDSRFQQLSARNGPK